MGELFDKKTVDESTILLKEDMLMPDYAPPELVHREGEIKAIAGAVSPLLDRKTPNNLFIHGNSGTGKTASVRHVLGEFKEAGSKAVQVYINCWQQRTQSAIYLRMLDALGSASPRRGLAADEILGEVLEIMGKEDTGVLVVLDELDALVFNEEQVVLYNLSRSHAKFGIIGITCDAGLLARIDDKITSSLRFTDMEFKPYSMQQMTDILAQRAKLALAKGSWDFDILEACAGIGKGNGGSVRLALEMLWKAAQLAEKREAAKIGIQDVKEASEKSFYRKIAKASPASHSFDLKNLSLSDGERIVVELLDEGEIRTADLYSLFAKKKQKSKRQIRNYLDTLEAKGVIEVLEDTNPSESLYRSRIVRLKQKI